jgi:CubicO group peptidase (beta-lactamase class C family)
MPKAYLPDLHVTPAVRTLHNCSISVQWVYGLLIFLLPHSTSFAQLTPHELKALTSFHKDLASDLKSDNLHGSISAALVMDGRIIWAEAQGDAGSGPADTSTIYRVCSITKMFTATVLLQLVEEGKVRLDDPVEKYLPEVKSIQGYGDQSKITLRELASHTSGLKREPDLPDRDEGPVDQWENKVLTCIPATAFDHWAGTEFLYSNIGFALLGLALERAAGKPYIQMVQERIFTPLHMDHSFFAVPDSLRMSLARGIDNNRSGILNTQLPLREVDGMGYRVPNGGIWSTPADLGRFVIGLTSGALLRPESIKEMETVPHGGKNYGLGLMLLTSFYIGHNGSDPGYTSALVIYPKGKYAVVLLRNYNIGATNLIKTSEDLLDRL